MGSTCCALGGTEIYPVKQFGLLQAWLVDNMWD